MYQKTKKIRLKGVKLKRLFKRVLERDNRTCQNPDCGARSIIDPPHHIIYKSHGGNDVMGNLVTLCRNCHSMIHDKGSLRIEIKDNSDPYRLRLKFINGFKKT